MVTLSYEKRIRWSRTVFQGLRHNFFRKRPRTTAVERLHNDAIFTEFFQVVQIVLFFSCASPGHCSKVVISFNIRVSGINTISRKFQYISQQNCVCEINSYILSTVIKQIHMLYWFWIFLINFFHKFRTEIYSVRALISRPLSRFSSINKHALGQVKLISESNNS